MPFPSDFCEKNTKFTDSTSTYLALDLRSHPLGPVERGREVFENFAPASHGTRQALEAFCVFGRIRPRGREPSVSNAVRVLHLIVIVVGILLKYHVY